MKPRTLLLLLILCLSILSCRDDIFQQEAEKGLLDLTAMDLSRQRYFIKGEWSFAPEEFLAEIPADRGFYRADRTSPQEGLPLYGTLQLRTRFPENTPSISLGMVEAQWAYRIYFDRKLLAQSGILGEDKEHSAPGKALFMDSFTPDAGEHLLVIQFSTGDHRDKNLPDLTLASLETIRRHYNWELFRDLFFAGSFFSISLLYFMLFLKNRKELSALWFACICILIMIRLLLVQTAFLDKLTPDSWNTFMLRVEYTAMALVVIVFYLYALSLFHAHLPKRKHLWILLPSITYAWICMTTSLLFFSRLLQIYQVVIIFTGTVALFHIIRAFQKGKEGARSLLILFSAMLIGAVLDILYFNRIITVGPFTGYAMYVGLMVQGMLLITRYTRNKEKVVHLSQNYRKANMALFSNQRKIEEQNKRLNHLSFTDQLTQLPNKISMLDILGNKIDLARREKKLLALFYLDLDNFKRINDTLGQKTGDNLLYAFARHLKQTLRRSDNIFRITSDEFIVVAEGLKETDQVTMLAEKMLQSLEKPFIIDGHEFFMTLSIGISWWEQNKGEEDIQSLIRKADIAVGKAKEQGKNSYVFYTPEMDKELSFRVKLEDRMRNALEQDQFQLYYQAQIDLRTGALHGFEALIRWIDPRDGLISPSQFIPLAEQSGLIVELGKWTLKESCRQLREWLDRGFRDFTLSVNLSMRQFEREDLIPYISSLIKEWKIPPCYLVMELTESALMMDVRVIQEKMNQLKNLGLRIAIDDFGTGYSNLGYLSSFPLDILKIDRMFIQNLRNNDKDRKLVLAIINIAHSLQLEIVAEGVEDEEDKDMLFSQGCYCIQGYLFSFPSPAEEMEEFFSRPVNSSLTD